VQPTDAASTRPTLLKTSTGYVAMWEEGTAGKAVFAHLLDANGAPSGDGVTVAVTLASVARPVIAPFGTGFAIAYVDNELGVDTIGVMYLDATLDVIAQDHIAEGYGGAGWPALATSSDGHLALMWSDRRGGIYDVHAAQLAPQSPRLLGDTPLRSLGRVDATLGRMIPVGGSGFLSAWEDQTDHTEIHAALTDASGAVSDLGLIEQGGGDANWPNMAYTGNYSAIVFYEFRASSPQIYLTLLDQSGQRPGGASDAQISSTPDGKWARYPDVKWTGSDFGVAWLDSRDGGSNLYFARVTCKQQ